MGKSFSFGIVFDFYNQAIQKVSFKIKDKKEHRETEYVGMDARQGAMCIRIICSRSDIYRRQYIKFNIKELYLKRHEH